MFKKKQTLVGQATPPAGPVPVNRDPTKKRCPEGAPSSGRSPERDPGPFDKHFVENGNPAKAGFATL